MSSEQELAQIDAPKEPEVKYIFSGQPTGWWAAAKDVREFDVEKVQSCKEDIDTLLVFAGLFSAVLSAFLVAVYPNLQQQPSDRIVYAIERVAVQTAGYRVNLTDGTLIAANILPPSPPSFQVSDNDIRVNVLWFASLIISLVTASFGMLVKQWLREFLAGEDPSALHRLRLRHFREPQMKAWMVYEIAGLLPILLHLSLGLFFVGLCYFTSSVHSSIGHTTIPLVAGWALCFFAATALPIFFPRCPYKVAFLKLLIARLHRLVRRSAEWLYHRRYRQYVGLSFAILVRRTTILIWTKCRTYMKSLVRAVATVAQDTRSLFRVAVDAAQDIPDEAILVGSPEFDLAILSSVDAIQGNDEMLATIIPDALLYTRPDSSDVVQLVIELLEHRVPTLEPLQRVVEYWPFKDMAPLDRLRPQARDYILSILFGHIKDLDIYGRCNPACFGAASQSPGRLCRDHTAVFRALLLVASAPRESLPPNVVNFLKQCFEIAYYYPGFWRRLCYDPVTTDHDASQKLERVLVVINLVNNLTNTDQIQLSLQHRVAVSTQIPHPYFPDLVDEHIDTTTYPWDAWQLGDSYGDAELKLSCMMFWLHAASEGLNSLRYETSADLPPLVTSVVGFSLRQFHAWWTVSRFYRQAEHKMANNSFRKMAHIAVKREDTALAFTTILIDELQLLLRSESPINLQGGLVLARTLLLSTQHNRDQPVQPPQQDPAVIRAVFECVMSKIAMYQEQELDITFHLGLCQVLEFFLITVYVPPDLREECRSMFSSLATSLPVSYPQASPPLTVKLQMLASNCLQIMNFEDRVCGKSDPPRSEEESIFPDTLLDTLLTLAGERFWDHLPRIPSKLKFDTLVGHSKLTFALETQPAGEPDLNSAAITDSASTSDQGIDTSELVPSTSEGPEPQPAYAMEDVEQTKAAHEEEGNYV